MLRIGAGGLCSVCLLPRQALAPLPQYFAAPSPCGLHKVIQRASCDPSYTFHDRRLYVSRSKRIRLEPKTYTSWS